MSEKASISNTDLKNGMQVLTPSGDVISILDDPKKSAVSAGQSVAETSIGLIYFADDLTSTILLNEVPAPENVTTLAGAL